MSQTVTPTFRPHRDRNSSRWVRMSDRIAKQVITIGGIGTIFVVLLVVFVLIGNVLPLFQSNRLVPLPTVQFNSDTPAIGAGVDEYGEICWTVDALGKMQFYSIHSGERLAAYSPNNGEREEFIPVRSVSISDADSSLLLGLENGSVLPVTFSFSVDYVKKSDLPEDVAFHDSSVVVRDSIIYRVTSSGLVRKMSIDKFQYHPPIAVSDRPIVAVDWKTPQAASSFDESMQWAWAATDGESLRMEKSSSKVNPITDAVTQESEQWSIQVADGKSNPVRSLMVDSRNSSLLTLDKAGNVVCWEPTAGERLEKGKSHLSLAGSESSVTCAAPLLGRSSFMLGAESGHIEAVSMSAGEQTQELLSIHRFEGKLGKVLSIASSPEARVIAANFERGDIGLYYVPTNRRLAVWSTKDLPAAPSKNSAPNGPESPVQPLVFFSSNAEVVGAVTPGSIYLWESRMPHPEASFSGFFSRLWYEGYSSPQHVWQSSTGNVEGEYKFGFMPLIFGTLKATFYSMLIGAPIALMAAVFGSEFMSSRWRTRFKPAIELMASVPSVVLGFIGALVLAPMFRDHLMACLLSVPAILFLFLLGAHCWLLLPTSIAIRAKHWRLPILMVLIPTGIYLASAIAAPLESLLFGGNITQWLAGQTGTGWSGWFCLSVLPMALLVAWLMSGPWSPWFQRIAASRTRLQFGFLNLVFFLVAILLVLVLSALVATGMNSFGLDPRGSVLGPYQERNALLVGCILGFAIIPLIYTISEDALQAVPQHLRSASLGCGATTWQTTIRVVIPTAMSGLFSAMMIGFGRAVGETMVVLMAAGNTPLMDVNPLNGYRTLSATLATELPEAARGSTHYHGLFLAALLLFCFTLVANTVAEMVRMRFRKRAFQL